MLPEDTMRPLQEGREERAVFLKAQHAELGRRRRIIDEVLPRIIEMETSLNVRIEREGKTEALLREEILLHFQHELLRELRRAMEIEDRCYTSEANIVAMWSYFYDHFDEEMKQREKDQETF